MTGPTGSGKTGLSISLAEELGGEIINADSMQVYRLMDIGTAKPTLAERGKVRHHLLDVIYPNEEYNAARYKRDAEKAIADISSRTKPVIVVGGTGLYIKALTKGLFQLSVFDVQIRTSLWSEMDRNGPYHLYAELKKVDPVAAEKIHLNDKIRIVRALEVFRLTGTPISAYHKTHGFQEAAYDCLKIGLSPDRDELYGKIANRARLMVENGLIDETKELLDAGYSDQLKSMQSIGYKHVIRYLRAEYGLDEMISVMTRDTQRYAKRQWTWFRADSEMTWFSPEQTAEIFRTAKAFLEK